ncbi:MAG: FAD-binding oxidoreductase [Nitrospira sp.]|nr:FAD-binding oxidoreductase [Nitrospira sp.]
MPDPKFTKPWHGVPRESIEWHPTVNEDACIGCGTCVTGCGRLVYRFDYDRKKPVVVDPLNCMVGCTTCANTCPTHAISFPPLSTVMDLEKQAAVRHAIEDDLIARRDILAAAPSIPHPDRLIHLVVRSIQEVSAGTRIVMLAPHTSQDCMCQFIPGQYLEIWVPGQSWMSRAYSIGNAPREDGGIELHIRRVPGGRVSAWIFDEMKVGDVVTARGPMGRFTVRSPLETPLVFVAGGTGFAPIKAMIEQQMKLTPERDLLLFWGVASAPDFYELDQLRSWKRQDPFFRYILAVERRDPDPSLIVKEEPVVIGFVSDAVRRSVFEFDGRDAYVAGPPEMITAVADALQARGIPRERILVDSFAL